MADPKITAAPLLATSRADARAAGAVSYFTGKPCKNGHTAPRFTSDGKCHDCNRERFARWYQHNSARVVEATRRWRKNNPGRRQETDARWREENRDRLREQQREKYSKNKARINARNRAWLAANPEKAKAIRRRYRAANLALYRAAANRRRVRRIEQAGDHPGAADREFVRLASLPRVRCYWCKKSTTPADRHIDHIVPLAAGGRHAAANLAASCATCNVRKSYKLPEQFSGQSEISFG